MPTKTANKRPASKSRKSVRERRQGSEAGSKRRQPAPQAPVFIATSLHTLRLKKKTGPEVYFVLNGQDADMASLSEIVKVCWEAYARAKLLITGEKTSALKDFKNVPDQMVLFMALDGLRKLLPSGWGFNLDCISSYMGPKPGSYEINLYRVCDWNFHHHHFEAGPVLEGLEKSNRSLHNVFLLFLKQLQAHGVDFWYQGMMGGDMEMMGDRLVDSDLKKTDPDFDGYRKDIEAYRKGTPAKYQKLLKSTKLVPVAEIQKRANRFKAGEPISNLIYQGCELLMPGYTLRDFGCYIPDDWFYDNAFLELEAQVTIIWKAGDGLSCDYSDTLDAMSQEGLQDPVMSVKVNANTPTLDFSELDKKARWPVQLGNFFANACNLIDKFKKDELKNRNAAKKL